MRLEDLITGCPDDNGEQVVPWQTMFMSARDQAASRRRGRVHSGLHTFTPNGMVGPASTAGPASTLGPESTRGPESTLGPDSPRGPVSTLASESTGATDDMPLGPPKPNAMWESIAAAGALLDEDDEWVDDDLEEAAAVDLITTLANDLEETLTLNVPVHFCDDPQVRRHAHFAPTDTLEARFILP